MEFSDEEVEHFMSYLEEEKVLIWVGMNEDGERTFVFDFERMKHIFPELYDAMMEEMNAELMNLYALGFITIEYDTNLTPKFKITEEGKSYLIENGVIVPEEFD